MKRNFTAILVLLGGRLFEGGGAYLIFGLLGGRLFERGVYSPREGTYSNK